MSRVAVAMSGGVDSSTAAGLLVREGHEVVGITLQLWDYGEVNAAAGRGRCCSPADVADARAVAAHLGIPHYVFDHSADFREEIVEPFVSSYADGRTPSPCITCNRRIKFDLLWRLADSLGAERLATGHYARLEESDRGPRLRRGRDPEKDQSYFLFDVPPARLRGVRFPVGDLVKGAVREEARSLGLPVAEKPESYELCFIPDGDKDRFVEERLPDERPGGEIRHVDGELLTEHDGLHRFTIGQRRGLGVNPGEKLYVISVDADDDRIVVGPREELRSEGLLATEANWISVPPPEETLTATACIRHRHRGVASEVLPGSDGELRIRFDEPQEAVTPGQGVALYDGELLLGGGWIEAPLA